MYPVGSNNSKSIDVATSERSVPMGRSVPAREPVLTSRAACPEQIGAQFGRSLTVSGVPIDSSQAASSYS